MKAIVNAWTSLSLIKRIVIGLIIGALIGLFGPKDIIVIELLGTLFVNALKAVAPSFGILFGYQRTQPHQVAKIHAHCYYALRN